MAEIAAIALVLLIGWALFPALGRISGAVMVVVGLVGAVSHESWAGWTIAVGAALWLAGSWLYSVKTSRYSSSLARVLFEHTALKWSLWQHWQVRRQRREAALR